MKLYLDQNVRLHLIRLHKHVCKYGVRSLCKYGVRS
jgi:hypothetical protein